MALPEYDVNQVSQPATVTEYIKHPEEGYLQYQPSTMRIIGRGPGKPPIKQPIKLYGKFIGTKQPGVPTCSEPGLGNAGCNKWAGCPFKALPFVGPMQLIIEHHGTVSNSHCFDYYETIDDRGKPLTNRHYGMDGWKVDTTRTTIDVRGHVPVTNALGQKIGATSNIWQKEIPDLGPPWWPEMKRKGLPLPPAAQIYPELVDPDGSIARDEEARKCGEKSPVPDSQHSASPAGVKRRTRKARKPSGTGSYRPDSDAESSSLQHPPGSESYSRSSSTRKTRKRNVRNRPGPDGSPINV